MLKDKVLVLRSDIMALFALQIQLMVKKFLKNVQLVIVSLKGGKNKIGPALWGVLGRKAGSCSRLQIF